MRTELDKLINPDLPTLDEKDHMLAKARYAMEKLTFAMMAGVTYIRYKEGLPDDILGDFFKQCANPEEAVKNEADEFLAIANQLINSEHTNPWDSLVTENIAKWLDTPHNGDCVGNPATCMRCYVEDLYHIPNSTTWTSKLEGSRLFNAWAKEKIELNN